MYTAIIDYQDGVSTQQVSMDFNTYMECWRYVDDKVAELRSLACPVDFAAVFRNHDMILVYSIEKGTFITYD